VCDDATVNNKDFRPKFLAGFLVLHAVVVALVWRDLRNRPADQVRGSKRVWRAASVVNTLGSVAYVLFGRRQAATERV
jgi:hypothetical protein